MKPRLAKIIHEIRSLLILIVIVLLFKVTIVEMYIVPTGSMENTILAGDFLIGNRFVYGMRTPDWIGIPWTDIGFGVPYARFPKFREVERGDVIIFKYPRDSHQKYVKRCIALPGDTLRIEAKKVYVNGDVFPLPEHGRFITPTLPDDYQQEDIFLFHQGNKDHFKPLRVPRKGDRIAVTPENALLLMHLMVLDGHELILRNKKQDYTFTVHNPDDLYRRKQSTQVFNDYYPSGNKIVPWARQLPTGHLYLDGVPIREIDTYTVKQDYYWAMGDNRDDSLDSRYWGFVPQDHLLGQALFTYMSLDLKTWVPRFDRVGTVIR